MNPAIRILKRQRAKLEEQLDETVHGSPEEDEIFEEIKKIDRKIEQIQDCPVSEEYRQRRKQMLFDQLLRCNFKAQVWFVKQVIGQYRTAMFLIHGDPEYGQRTLAYRLTRLKMEWETGQYIPIDAGSRGVGKSIRRLWGEVAKKLGLDPETDSQDIAKQVGKWLETQDVIFVVHGVDSITPTILSSWLKEFWNPLVTITEKVTCQRQHTPTQLLLFLVDYEGNVCDCSEIHWIEKIQEPYKPFSPLLLPKITRFPKHDLEALVYDIIELLPCGISVDTLITETQNGTPDLVYVKICKYCGFSWEGEIIQ